MTDEAGVSGGWRIEFNDERVASAASMIADDLGRAGVRTDPAALRRPRDATLGTPEIIITILVTAAAKAVIVAGLRAVERTLERQLGDDHPKRAQIVLVNSAHQPGDERRFPISLRGIGKDALKGFFDDVVSAVDKE
jgi:hypothetical protein